MAAELLDWTGRPINGIGAGGGAIYEGSQDSRYRLNRPRLDKEMALLVTRERHRAMVADSRWIFQSFPLVSGAVRQKWQYVTASRFDPQFLGEDDDWGRKAEKLLRRADRICDVRGPMFNFAKSFRIGGQLRDIDGDWFIVLTESPNGFPMFQFLETYRCGTRWGNTGRAINANAAGERVVEGGTYDGAKILNGVIYNDQGRPIAYRILGSTPERDRDIAARNILHVSDPQFFSEGRTIPNIAYAVLDWYDIKETRNFEKIGQKLNSALTLIEKRQSRKSLNAVGGPTGAPLPAEEGFHVDTFAAGMIRHVGANGEITAHESRRPSDGWLKFDRTVMAGAFYGMNWRVEMLDMSLLSGAPTRGFQDNINTVIYDSFEWLEGYARACRVYQVAKLIKRGDLEEHPEWDMWGHTPPPEFQVDAAKSSQTDRENIRAGIDTTPGAIKRRGGDPERQLREQARYLKIRNQVAEAEGLDPRELGRSDKPGDDAQEKNNNPQNTDD